MLQQIFNAFPENWIYGHYEREIIASIADQIEKKWPRDHCLLLNTTWLDDRTLAQLHTVKEPIDRLFVLSTVDYPIGTYTEYIDYLKNTVGVGEVYYLGNWDGPYYFNFFAIVCRHHFETYNNTDLELKELRYRYICYNRKPYPHRVLLVKQLLAQGLDQHGVITLGRPWPGYEPADLEIPYLTIGERDEDYVKYGHWYDLNTSATPHEIPHDLFSLHNWEKWQHHFLHIIGTTAPSNDVPLFINQIDFKPILGLRPWIINGQNNHAEFFERQGFRTFNHWFPDLDLVSDLTYDFNLYARQQVVAAVEQIVAMSESDILSMYSAMLPDLVHNKQRFYDWAAEQESRVHNLFL